MAYTPKTLAAWLTDNPNYDQYKGTVSGKPLIYQAKEGSPSLEAKDWYVWDWISEFPDLAQSPAEADISKTGSVNRVIIPTVPDAPSASELEVFLGTDTDEGIEALEGIQDAFDTALEGGEKFYLGHFMGIGKRSQIYQASVAWQMNTNGAYPDPITSGITITPNLGGYNKFEKITNVGG